ncbi:MAG: helix-turn-helix transcriptional regulator [Pyrobaculum sp.]
MDFRELMRQKGFSPYKLELACGIRHDKIQHYAAGRRFPNLKNIIKLAEALGCQPAEVFNALYETYLKVQREVEGGANPVHDQ